MFGVGTTSRDPNVYIFQFDGTKFVPSNNIMLNARPYAIKYFKTKDASFLAVAIYELHQSMIMKWNGEGFEISQKIASSQVHFSLRFCAVNSMCTHRIIFICIYLLFRLVDLRPQQ